MTGVYFQLDETGVTFVATDAHKLVRYRRTDVVATDSRLEITIEPRGDFKYTTTFVGTRGSVLAISHDLNPAYELTGSEAYVRARVEDSGGSVAWVQPVFTDGR